MADRGRPGLAEVLLVWALFAVVAVEVLVTYARLPASDLYHVSGSGLEGGASRALVFVGYPASLAAIALLAIVADRLDTRTARVGALSAFVLCASIGVPGVIDQDDLDARPVNALAGIGIALALVLTAAALARGCLGQSAPLGGGDAARIGAAIVLLLAATPWIAADLGFTISDAPVLGSIFLGEQIKSVQGQETLMAVHLGHHHGMDGTLLAWTALALSRVPARMKSRRLRAALVAFLALMLVYGLANALQDFWTEQLVKRGAISASIPSVIRPDASWAWVAIVAVAAVICLAVFRVVRVDQRQGGTA
jgi:hypothetical protein